MHTRYDNSNTLISTKNAKFKQSTLKTNQDYRLSVINLIKMCKFKANQDHWCTTI
jgi:hypothetical protein